MKNTPLTDPAEGDSSLAQWRELAPLDRTLSRGQRTRPPEPLKNTNCVTTGPLDPQPNLARRRSRNSFIGFFGRSKSVRASASTGQLNVVTEEPNETRERSRSALRSSPHGPQVSALLSPVSTRSGQSSKVSRSRSVKSPRSASMDPPPLFQAYPQSVKHTTLTVPVLEADFILKAQKAAANSVADFTNEGSDDPHAEGIQQKQEEMERRHRRRMTGSLSKSDWARKIYVLVTSGYILQYADNGTFDRLPERMMRLQKDSAVFVSDAIPGRPYVLQISQCSTSNGEVMLDSSKTIFSKIGIRTADSRRITSNFLLIFETPEEMQSWLVIVRREIESLGGEIRPRSPSQPIISQPVLQHKLSKRFLVTRDANRLSRMDASNETSKVMGFASSQQTSSENMSPLAVHPGYSDRQRTSFAPTETPSLSTSATSLDLEEAQESRQSVFIQENQRHSTCYSRPTSSVSGSYNFTLPDLAPFDYPDPPHALHAQVLSMQACIPDHVSEHFENNGRPKLQIDVTRTSVVPPNFSVPSFSRRFSPATSPSPSSPSRSTGTSQDFPDRRPMSRAAIDFDFGEPGPVSIIDELPSSSTIVAPPLSTRGSRLSTNFTAGPIHLSTSCIATADADVKDDWITSNKGRDLSQGLPEPSGEIIRPQRHSSLQHARRGGPMEILSPPTTQLPTLPTEVDSGPRDTPRFAASTLADRAFQNQQLPSGLRHRRDSVQAVPRSYKPSSWEREINGPAGYIYRGPSAPLVNQSPDNSSSMTALRRVPLTVTPRKSMPDLMALGPPAPPPNCPLPALPPGLLSSAQHKTKLRTRPSLNLPRVLHSGTDFVSPSHAQSLQRQDRDYIRSTRSRVPVR